MPTSDRPHAAVPATLLSAVAVFLSALLLFLVQPILAKAMLPAFGGSSGVWATAVVFFQLALLSGYAYAHGLQRLPPRMQGLCHGGLLAASVLWLPLDALVTPAQALAASPALAVLTLLARTVGLPYLLISATSPLVQAWSARGGVALPYWLFAVSNLGSIAALLAYPFLVEPWLGLQEQARVWTFGYAAFAFLLIGVALRHRQQALPESAPIRDWDRGDALEWTALAGAASALLLAVTNHVTEYVASMPLLWMLPLSAYLLSFVVAFAMDGGYPARLFRWVLPVTLLLLGIGLVQQGLGGSLRWLLPLLTLGVFVVCWFCHGELARQRPGASGLTAFYLFIALGGSLGSLFVALVAPAAFTAEHELPIAVAACAVLMLRHLFGLRSSRLLLRFALVVLAALLIGNRVRDGATGVLARARNFYGALTVSELPTSTGSGRLRFLTHGSIQHGAQFTDPVRSAQPATYYGPRSGIGLLLAGRPSPRRVGLVGLGVGSLAAYGRPGDTFRFFEINPLVVELARRHFTYLARSESRNEIVVGDGRLALERDPGGFDVIAVDAFAGDAIPLHLLTREAFAVYFQKLQPDGVLAFHVTNRYVDLPPAILAVAEGLGKFVLLIPGFSNAEAGVHFTLWVLVANRAFTDPVLVRAGQFVRRRPGLRAWTDDYANLLPLWR